MFASDNESVGTLHDGLGYPASRDHFTLLLGIAKGRHLIILSANHGMSFYVQNKNDP